MSLIQEALKRQQEATERTSPAMPASAGPASKPESPAPPPPAAPPPPLRTRQAPAAAAREDERDDEAGRPWLSLVGILLILVVLVGGGIWMIWFAYQRWMVSESASPPTEQATAAVPGPTADPVTEPDTPKPPDPGTLTAVATTTTPEPAVTPVPVPGPAEPAVSPVVPDPAPVPAATPDAVADTGAVSSPTATTTVDIAWPKLSLSGCIGRGRTGSAIINGQVIGVGESIEGARLLTIHPQGVELQVQGQTRFLKVGNALP